MANRQHYINEIASWVGGYIQATEISEMLNVSQEEVDEMSDAELARVQYAIDYVTGRIYKMVKGK